MELLDRLHRTQPFQSVSARIRALSDDLVRSPHAAFLIRERGRFMGAALLLASLCTGIWARDLARAESLSLWLAEHPPSESVWRHALQSRGYHSLTEERAYRRVTRTLPSLSDDPSSIWISTDGRWIATYRRSEERLDASLYCLQCKVLPTGWLPAGRGWEAFDPVLKQADTAVTGLKPAVKLRPKYADPKELQY